MVMACYVKGKDNTFVQSKKTQVYLFRLITLTCKEHVLAVFRPFSLEKNREYKKGPFRYYCIFLYMFLCWHTWILPKYKPKHVAYMWWQLNWLNKRVLCWSEQMCFV